MIIIIIERIRVTAERRRDECNLYCRMRRKLLGGGRMRWWFYSKKRRGRRGRWRIRIHRSVEVGNNRWFETFVFLRPWIISPQLFIKFFVFEVFENNKKKKMKLILSFTLFKTIRFYLFLQVFHLPLTCQRNTITIRIVVVDSRMRRRLLDGNNCWFEALIMTPFVIHIVIQTVGQYICY